ncbi:uncharacterized protein N7529_004740 [Penicillium soppii]|uniref:uncharacterized protein n=1 Tax=Penicillium soppii TaxID=69789 RepID=UPI00254939A5|nr:uncharacterized protein N7529_004740 [Penicillium soppii]KAJ5872387.1 hypothetical protein N7529_004740 [Penicillium soppii]
MRPSLILTSVLATLVAADSSTTTISYFGLDSGTNTYGADPGAYTSTAARVIGSDSTATTYEIGCLKGAAKCALPHSVTLIQGPATYSMSGEYSIQTLGATGIITDVEECSFTHTSESVSCSWSVAFTVSSGDITVSTSNIDSSTSIAPESVKWRALEVTAGAATSTASGSGTKATSGATSTASGSGTKATAGATSTGAAAAIAKPLITAAPMGAAAIAAIVAMF